MTKKYAIIKSTKGNTVTFSSYKYNLYFKIFGATSYGYITKNWVYSETEAEAIEQCKKELKDQLKTFTYEIIEIIEL